MDGIAFGIVITGATLWAGSVLGVLLLGIAARRNDPRVVVDDPWERPDVAARWRAYERSVDSTEKDPAGRSTRRSNPRSAA
jgi:hypothetical protein